jgi:hypothetical protein
MHFINNPCPTLDRLQSSGRLATGLLIKLSVVLYSNRQERVSHEFKVYKLNLTPPINVCEAGGNSERSAVKVINVVVCVPRMPFIIYNESDKVKVINYCLRARTLPQQARVHVFHLDPCQDQDGKLR